MWCVTGWWRHDWGEGRQGKDTRPLLGSTYPHSRYHPNTHHIPNAHHIQTLIILSFFSCRIVDSDLADSTPPLQSECHVLGLKNDKFENDPLAFPHCAFSSELLCKQYIFQTTIKCTVFGLSPVCILKWAHMHAIHFPVPFKVSSYMPAIHFPNCNQVHSVWPPPPKSLDALCHITKQLLNIGFHRCTSILYQYTY